MPSRRVPRDWRSWRDHGPAQPMDPVQSERMQAQQALGLHRHQDAQRCRARGCTPSPGREAKPLSPTGRTEKCSPPRMQPAAASADAAAAEQRQEEKEEEGEQQQPQVAHLHSSLCRIRTGKSHKTTAAPMGQQLRPRRAFAGNRMATCLCLQLCARCLRNPPQMNAKRTFRRRRRSICSGWLATQHDITPSHSVTRAGV